MVSDYMSSIVHAKSIVMDMEYYENSNYYDTLHRTLSEAPFRPLSIVNGLLGIGRSFVSFVGVAAMLLALNPLIAGLLLIAVFPRTIVRVVFARRMYGWQRKATQTERQAYYYNWMLTTDTHAKELRVFGLGSLFVSRFREIRSALRIQRFRILINESVFGTVVQFAGIAAMLVAFGYIARQTIHGQVSTGSLVMYFQAFQTGQGALGDLLGNVAGLYEDNLFLSYLYEFLELPQKITKPANPAPVPRPMREGIVFDHVKFEYPTSTRPVIDDVSFRIAPGEVVALVGANGAGKTTIIKLLNRLYDTVEGGISLDGIDIRDFDQLVAAPDKCNLPGLLPLQCLRLGECMVRKCRYAC